MSLILPQSLTGQTAKPIFHLEANTGITVFNTKVKYWVDSINHITATQLNSTSQPEFISNGIGNRPTLRFNGSSSYLTLPSVFPVNKDYTIIVVCKANGPTNNILGGNSRTLWLSGNSIPKILHNADFNNQVSSSFDPGFDPVLIVAQYNNKTHNGKLILNGIYEDSAYCPINTDSTIFISAYQNSYFFNGDISEIILFDQYLPIEDRKKIEFQLKEKYRITDPPKSVSYLSNIPSNHQFFPRDLNNEANIEINGQIDKLNYDSVSLKLFKNQILVSNSVQLLNYDSTNKAFIKLSVKIKAELSEYSVEVHLKNQNQDSVIASREHLLCGDVYIVTGQSNSIFGGNSYVSPFIKTYGKNYSLNKNDTSWSVAIATGNGGLANIGAWGMDLAKSIVENNKIPVCILNGGVGGTTIQQHQRNDLNPGKPDNIYGSLLFRAQKSDLAHAIKAIFWYQGESNSSNLYFENFESLHQDWMLDYPNIKKVYVIQIHQGCGAGDHMALREIQRNLPMKFPNIRLISTMNIPEHDGCHYSVNGYLALAKTIYPLVQKDFYNGTDKEEYYPPNIKHAYFSKLDLSEITLDFDKTQANLSIQPNRTVNGKNISINDYFALDEKWEVIKNIKAEGNKIILTLKNPKMVQNISYLPELTYHNSNQVYQGPYIINENQIGALCFHKVNVETRIPSLTNEFHSSDQIYLFPNPLKDNDLAIISTILNKEINNVEIKIKNSLGQQVFTKHIDHIPAGSYRTELIFSTPLARGILIWEIKSKNLFKSGTLLKI
ncbi:MAG: hypothetical protein IT267_04445 [Saprospiraceae bacterium]|nr:hypothetical protein [Saprospiraceae bacterium]